MTMMHQRIDAPRRWCILRTSGGSTLRLATSLAGAGLEAWTPKRTFKRVKPGRCNLIDGKPATVEVDAPILPTFVFARAAHLVELAFVAADPSSRHPAFSILREAGRYPLVSDHAVAGLRQAEAEALAELERLREAETRQERRRLRAAAANNERERRKALRAEVKHFAEGAVVEVTEAGAFAGMTGIVKSNDGRSAMVAFGGWLTMKIDAWQLSEDAVQSAQSSLAAE